MAYDSYIAEQDEPKYQEWLAKQRAAGQNVSDKDYDMRGFWLSGQAQAANGHYTDEFKKPSHPTFSNESKYSGANEGEIAGGSWTPPAVEGGKDWTFKPSEYNLQQRSPEELKRYLGESDPDVKLDVSYALQKLKGIK